MPNKKSSKGKSSGKLAAFNRTQEIYKLLEKGIIESEALLSTAADRPTDDAHVLDLLESANAPGAHSYSESSRKSGQSKKHRAAKPSKSSKKKIPASGNKRKR